MNSVLPAAQRRLLPHWQPLLDEFVLYGGTAIALHLAHRISVDFDFFTDRRLDKNALYHNIPILQSAKTIEDSADTLSLLVSDELGEGEVKVSFFGGISFGRVGSPTRLETMFVASMEDLLATKLKTIMQRISAKDYFDISAILLAGNTLASGLGAASELFAPSFSSAECLKALVYFEGGDMDTLDEKSRQVLLNAVAQIQKIPTLHRISSSLR